jgi:predicted ATPase/DNA-binding SARP family transcriptional activator
LSHSTLQLTLFGGFSAHLNGNALTDFRSDKIRGLLAYLAVEADRPHRREVLATLFWGEMADSFAKRNLRQSLYRLKQSVVLPDSWLEATRQTVMVRKAWLGTDIGRFQHLIDICETHTHRHLHDCSDCLQRLEEAAALYHGDFLQGLSLPDALGFEEWQTVIRERCHQLALTALGLLTDAHEKLSNYMESVRFAQRQIELEAWRESAHRQVMRLFALQGQRSEAVAQFERCRAILWEELGVEPEKGTRTLLLQILAGEFSAETTPQTDTRPTLYNFPVQVTPFIGRKYDIDQLCNYLAQPTCRLLTIVGAGGMGKTRLVVEAASVLANTSQLFIDGLYFVALASVTNPDLLATTIGSRLGIKFEVSSTPMEQLLAYLSSRNCLLVLDNFEQISAAKRLVVEMLQHAPAVKIVITSREALKLHAEQRLPLAGLVETEAVELFAQSARRAQPSFTISAENTPVLHHICNLTEGLPLALEMAASWTRLLTCQQIANQIAKKNAEFLEERFDLPDRHRSVRAVFDYSWSLLNSAECNALAQLAIFRAGTTLEAILAITDAGVAEVANLLDKSLIGKRGDRFVHHPLLQQLAAEKLVASGTQQQIATRHAAYYTELLQQKFADIQIGNQRVLGLISAEIGNIDKAWSFILTHKQIERIKISYRPLATFYQLTHRYSEWRSAFQLAAAKIDTDPNVFKSHPLVRAGIFGRYATALENEAAYDAAYQTAQRSLRIAVEHGLDEIIPQVTLAIGRIQYFLGQMHDAEKTLRDAVVWSKKMDAQYELTDALDFLATTLLSLGATDEAITTFKEAQTRAAQIGDWHVEMLAVAALGFIASVQGEYDKAWFYWNQVLAFEGLGENNLLYGRLHNYISLQYITQFEFEQAYESAERGHRAMQNLTFTRVYFDCQCARALIAAFLGEFDRAWEIERTLREIAVRFVADTATRSRRAETVRGVMLILSGQSDDGITLLHAVQQNPTTGWENMQLINHFFEMLQRVQTIA